MLKKIFLYSLLLTTGALHAMHDNSQIQPWAQNALSVHIETMKTTYELPIHNGTKIADLKKQLEEDEDIPPHYQNISALYRSGWTLWIKRYCSEALDDNAHVKQIMSDYNTQLLKLYLLTK